MYDCIVLHVCLYKFYIIILICVGTCTHAYSIHTGLCFLFRSFYFISFFTVDLVLQSDCVNIEGEMIVSAALGPTTCNKYTTNTWFPFMPSFFNCLH